MKVAILGAGAWGTGIATSLSAHHEVTLWGRDAAIMDALRQTRVNGRYLPQVRIPESVALTAELAQAVEGRQLLVLAAAMAGLRPTLRALRELECDTPLLWLCKGFERGSAKLPHQVAREELPEQAQVGALSGPSFAKDVACGLPTAITLASASAAFARDCARALNSSLLRIYSSDDLIGVEVGGAVKNVIAVAAGVSDGLRLGESARAALITRGLAEMTRLGIALGGRLETFLGLAGAGDLLLTCTSDQSRNRRVGLALASGEALPHILERLGHVAEGVFTAYEARNLADALRIEAPIASAVCKVLDGALTPRDAVADLLRREPRPEAAY